MLALTLRGAPPTVRAYAATAGQGYNVLLFNLDRAVPADALWSCFPSSRFLNSTLR